VFRSRLVGELLALLTADPARQWTLEELAKRTGSPYQTVTAEVRRLAEAGLLVEGAIGRSKLVRIDETNLNFPALAELTGRSFGPPLILAEEFADLANIDQVFIYGSWAARHAGELGPPPNDVDVLIVATQIVMRCMRRPVVRADALGLRSIRRFGPGGSGRVPMTASPGNSRAPRWSP
jgi:hypothetical protein